MGEDRVSANIKVGQVWEYHVVGGGMDVYLITNVNEDNTASMVDLSSNEHFERIRVNIGTKGRGWKRIT